MITDTEILTHECKNLIAYWSARFMYYLPTAASGPEAERLSPLLPFIKSLNKHSEEVENDWIDNLEEGFDWSFSTSNKADNARDAHEVRKILRKNMRRLKGNAWKLNKKFADKLQHLCSILDINEQERTLLIFAIVLNTCEPFKELIEMVECGNLFRLRAISFMLELDAYVVKNFFTGNSRISQLGLISTGHSLSEFIFHDIELVEGLKSYLFLNGSDDNQIFKNCFSEMTPSSFKPRDFDHVAEKKLLKMFLEQSLAEKAIGTNILIYGPSGSGKTEFVKSLQLEGFQLYEIPARNHKGESISEIKRLTQYRIAQSVLSSNPKAVLVMDDADFMLDEEISILNIFIRSDDNWELSKAAMNRLLEGTTIPTIWICNSSQEINHAFKRRFGMIIPVKTLPKKARKRMITNYFNGVGVSNTWIERLADQEIHPGTISRCAETLRLICKNETKNQKETEKIAINLLNNMLHLFGRPSIDVSGDRLNPPFVIDAINASHDINSLIKVMRTNRRGKFLFHGSPGTGKTALVKEIAKNLDVELIIRHASDLLSPFVGETEANIAELFTSYSAKGCILFLDEADSLLWARSNAVRSWEVTVINEMLTRMECYKGLFICATNRLEALDRAVLRRFDIKVEFRLIQPEQAWKLFVAIFGNKAKESHREVLESMSLTLGNFGTVFRKLKLYEAIRPITPDSFLSELQIEQNGSF